jgi:hypothetical protein
VAQRPSLKFEQGKSMSAKGAHATAAVPWIAMRAGLSVSGGMRVAGAGSRRTAPQSITMHQQVPPPCPHQVATGDSCYGG